jgi:hypothetical protein
MPLIARQQRLKRHELMELSSGKETPMGTHLQMIWGFLKKILIIDLLIFGVASLIWFTGVIRITDHFGTLLQILGVIAIVLGALSVTGNLMIVSDLNYQASTDNDPDG